MSKTAVLISGQMRTFAQCLPSLYWHVFRKLTDPHFFISCAEDEQASTAYLLEGYYKGRVQVEIVKQPSLPEPAKRYALHAPYAISAPIQSIIRQLWHYNQVWEMFSRVSGQTSSEFDTFIRCRPDLFFHRFDVPAQPYANEFLGLWKSRCGGVNDRFAIMGPKAAEAYFTAFLKLDELLVAGCPLHPESVQQAAMEIAGIGIRNTLTCEFTGIRLPGAGENQPLLEYPGEMADFIATTCFQPITTYAISGTPQGEVTVGPH